jgi:DNA-directed RNA polymerase alpha subunit
LTGWKIDIKGGDEGRDEEKRDDDLPAGKAGAKSVEGLSTRVANTLDKAGIEDLEKLKEMSDEELKEIKGIGPKAVEEIRNLLK